MKTTLEVFNKVSEHLLAQNEQSQDEDGVCVYRSETGLKCAVGCLITDDFYTKSWEYFMVDMHGPVAYALYNSGVIMTNEMLDLLRTLQRVHDHKEPETWEEELEIVKLRFFLGGGEE